MDSSPTYQRTSRRRWTFHQFRCLSSDEIRSVSRRHADKKGGSRLTPGEVTTLQHELGDDTVERTSLVSESVRAGGKFTEVFGSLGDYIVVEPKDDATGGLLVDSDVELMFIRRDKESKIAMSGI